jgi:hypothetical protein
MAARVCGPTTPSAAGPVQSTALRIDWALRTNAAGGAASRRWAGAAKGGAAMVVSSVEPIGATHVSARSVPESSDLVRITCQPRLHADHDSVVLWLYSSV